MPKTKVAPRVETRLHPEDYKYFESLCRDQSKTKGQLAREAILHYLHQQQHKQVQHEEAVNISKLQLHIDRLCGLLYKLGVDCNTTARFFWTLATDEERNTFEDCHDLAVNYMRDNLTPEEAKTLGSLIE